MNNTQMIRGILEWCVLSTVSDCEKYSQEICVYLQKRGLTDLSDGTLFPLMLRLEKEGYFIVERKENKLGPSRKYYRLSDYGKQELENFKKEWSAFKNIIDSILGGQNV